MDARSGAEANQANDGEEYKEAELMPTQPKSTTREVTDGKCTSVTRHGTQMIAVRKRNAIHNGAVKKATVAADRGVSWADRGVR